MAIRHKPVILFSAALLGLFVAIFPSQGFAQECEPNGNAATTVNGLMAAEQAYSQNRTTWTELGWVLDLEPLRNATLGDMNYGLIMGDLNTFWSRWLGAWKGLTAQLSSSTLDETRQLGSVNDASNALSAALDEQKEHIRAQSNYQPTEQACRFDTAASALSVGRQTARALENGYEWDFMQLGNNEKAPAGNNDEFIGSAQYGSGNFMQLLWKRYQTTFCDYKADNGNAGCSPDPLPPGTPSSPLPPAPDPNLLPNADMDVLPGKMLFSQYTINMSNPVALDAVHQLIYNLTSYKIPEPLVYGAIGSVAAEEDTLARRKYLARMDTAGSLLYALVADRTPGPPAPEVYNMRTQQYGIPSSTGGTVSMLEASPTPSEREIRQSVVEQLWDPNYYKDLYDNPSTIAQKDVYLKAYELVMLYDIIARQEKISNAYAVETADILEQSSPILGNISQTQPFNSR